jgi:hypothetical protein
MTTCKNIYPIKIFLQPKGIDKNYPPPHQVIKSYVFGPNVYNHPHKTAQDRSKLFISSFLGCFFRFLSIFMSHFSDKFQINMERKI